MALHAKERLPSRLCVCRHANGHGVNGHPPGSAEALGITPHTDPIEAQQLALAAAASQREAARRQPSRTPSRAPSQHHHLPPGAAAPRPLDEERQVRLAIDASLQEQQARTRREAEDADLRAAIEASLRCAGVASVSCNC